MALWAIDGATNDCDGRKDGFHRLGRRRRNRNVGLMITRSLISASPERSRIARPRGPHRRWRACFNWSVYTLDDGFRGVHCSEGSHATVERSTHPWLCSAILSTPKIISRLWATHFLETGYCPQFSRIKMKQTTQKIGTMKIIGTFSDIIVPTHEPPPYLSSWLSEYNVRYRFTARRKCGRSRHKIFDMHGIDVIKWTWHILTVGAPTNFIGWHCKNLLRWRTYEYLYYTTLNSSA